MSTRDQAQDAQHLYDERSAVYDDSWHTRFTRHMTEFLQLQPGQHVLDLACGTGLMTYRESTAVGSSGSVIGVDISGGMLAQAEMKKAKHETQNISFYQHSITDLDSLAVLDGRKFDAITCMSATVLLPQPAEAMKHWVSYLKPGGKLFTDVTHPKSQIGGIIFEKVGKEVGRPVPCYRLNFASQDDLRSIMEEAGLTSVDVKLVAQLKSRGGSDDLADFICEFDDPVYENVWSVDDGEKVFETRLINKFTEGVMSPDVRDKAKERFVEEWAKLGDANGKVFEVDGAYIGLGTKA